MLGVHCTHKIDRELSYPCSRMSKILSGHKVNSLNVESTVSILVYRMTTFVNHKVYGVNLDNRTAFNDL
jgi:hypothetical protein